MGILKKYLKKMKSKKNLKTIMKKIKFILKVLMMMNLKVIV